MTIPRSRARIYRAVRRPLAAVPVAVAAVGWPIVAPPGLLGQEPAPLVTDRPDQTESTAVVAPGFVQLELGWTVSEGSDGSGEVRAHTLPEALVRVGVLDRLEARVELPVWSSVRTEAGASTERADGFGDPSLGVKLGLAEGGGAAPSVALLAATSLPTGEEGFGSERADPSFRLALASDPVARFSVGWNAGLAWVTEAGPGPAADGSTETRVDFLYTVAVGIGLSERLGMFVESFGFAGLEASRASRHSVDGGFTFLVTHNLQLDVRGGAGLDRDADDWFLGAGFTTRLPR